MRSLSLFICLLTFFCTSAVSKTPKEERYVVVVSLDGFRWDYPQWYDTPAMDRMAKEGVESGLIPCFPSKTFPNHYSIATGLVPDKHGIIHNTFYEREKGKSFSLSNPETKNDPRYYGGEPIWLTAKRHGIKSSIFYWPGSDVPVQGEYPDSYLKYDSKNLMPVAERFKSIVKELAKPESIRPHLVMAYSEQPDHNGHTYGPQAKETRQAVEEMDSLIGVLYNDLMALPIASKIDFILLSDHGMALITPEQQIPVSKYLKKEWYVALEGNMPALIYAAEGKNGENYADSIYCALKDVQHMKVWRKGEVPAELSYGTNKNMGDIIVSPDLGWIFYDGKVTVGGMHGFDPGYTDMHALFRAVGPDFEKGKKTPHFHNTDIYPMICRILGME